MARSDNTYSRVVGALKVILPLAALVLLSTLFLLSRGREDAGSLRYTDSDIAALLKEPRMTAPTYTGVTRDGSAIRLSADAAIPGATPDAGGRADRPRLLLVAPDGGQTTAEADEARIDPAARTLLLTGAVRIATQDGYRIDSALVVATLDRTRIESPGPVVADSPQGHIDAGTLLLQRADARSPEVLVFKGGVKLLYEP